jgi:hypothetical protein
MKRCYGLITVLAFLALIAAVSGPALAREPIQDRIANQQDRINQGVTSGALTKAEADTLRGNLDHVRDTFGMMKADGRLNDAEEGRLHKMLDENSEMIYKKKTNMNIKKLY